MIYFGSKKKMMGHFGIDFQAAKGQKKCLKFQIDLRAKSIVKLGLKITTKHPFVKHL